MAVIPIMAIMAIIIAAMGRAVGVVSDARCFALYEFD